MKCLTEFKGDIKMVKPGTITHYDLFTKGHICERYFHLEFPITYTNDQNSIEMIKETLYQSVKIFHPLKICLLVKQLNLLESN